MSELSRVSAVVLAAAALGGLYMWLGRRRRLTPNQLMARLVAITGCDSGVGYSAALHCHRRGFTVLAMVLRIDSSGARALLELGKSSGRMEVIAVNVTKAEEVSAAVLRASNILENNTNLVFHAVINNAGVMVFGETEWQTENTISLQLDVNLNGAIRVTKLFSPLLRAHRGRVINVSSHCASLPLPGLAVYAASKAGLHAWSDGLRLEWAKYGINVISLIPGAFFQQTNILSRQMEFAKEMEEAMTEEAKRFYSGYYQEYQQYLSGLAGEKPASKIESAPLYLMLDSALLDIRPRTHYHDTPWRYWVYHSLAAVSPPGIRDWLVLRFTAMPTFKTSKKSQC